MNLDLQRPMVFKRISNFYTFSNNPLENKSYTSNIFMPWDEKLGPDLMFNIKSVLLERGEVLIPLLQKDLSIFNLDYSDVLKIKDQVRRAEETQLIMSNLDSIHVFNIKDLIIGESVNSPITAFSSLEEGAANIWLKVNDVYVLEANHVGNHFDVKKELIHFIREPQTQKVFNANDSLDSSGSISARWIEQNRALTYDYYIRSCELRENIYQGAWPFLLRKTQHELITSELLRHQGILVRGTEKWEMLKSSFDSYKNGVLLEIAAIYLAPLVETIKNFNCLQASWLELQEGLIHPKLRYFLQSATNAELIMFESLDEVQFYFENAKSLFFSLEKRLGKRDFNESYLLVERFLDRQNSLVDSFLFRKLKNDIQCLKDIEKWILNQQDHINDIASLNQMNLKLSHLLSKLLSSSINDNLLFKLLEEKASHFSVQTSLEEEVKNLEYTRMKKTA